MLWYSLLTVLGKLSQPKIVHPDSGEAACGRSDVTLI